MLVPIQMGAWMRGARWRELDLRIDPQLHVPRGGASDEASALI